jgi:hypothetical protein
MIAFPLLEDFDRLATNLAGDGLGGNDVCDVITSRPSNVDRDPWRLKGVGDVTDPDDVTGVKYFSTTLGSP